MIGFSDEHVVEFLREHPGVSAKRCLGMLVNKHAGMMREDTVDKIAEMLDDQADELMRKIAQTGSIRSEQNADGTVRWFVA